MLPLNRSLGGFVGEKDRVNGIVAVSRAFGDIETKKFLICEPYISVTKITEKDKFIVLACDGVWDVLDNESVRKIVVGNETNINKLARRVRDVAFSLHSAGIV